jgi:hypothetical protein
VNRSSFGSWGIGMEPGRFAAALAAVGVAAGRQGSAALDAVEQAWASRAMKWELPEPPYDAYDAERLADVWFAARRATREAAGAHPADPGALAADLRPMEIDWPADRDPTWVLAQLSRNDIGPLSVHISGTPSGAAVHWTWPLEIGLLDDVGSEELLRLLGSEEELWPSRFARPRTVTAGGSCDLLLLTAALRDAAGAVLGSGIRASCLVSLRPPTDDWAVTAPLMQALQSHVGAAGFGFAPVPAARRADWLGELLISFAHDHPLDVALRAAAQRVGAAPPLLLADQLLLSESRLTSVARRLGSRMEATRAQASGPLRGDERSRVEALTFDSELHGASELMRLESESREAGDTPAEARFIQARFLAASGEPLTTGLEPDVDQVIEVRVGPTEASWTAAVGKDFPAPEGDGPHLLTVVLTAPGALPEPAVEQIVLPTRGASTSCRFHVRPGPGTLHARIVVLHGNRVLQTATLTATVPAAEGAELVLAAEPETTVRLRLDELDLRRPFDAALVVDEELTTVTGGKACVLLPDRFEAAVDGVRDLLEEAVLEPQGFDSLDDESSLTLLRALAAHGSALYDAFMLNEGAQAVVDAQRLQVVPVRQGADFPLEFVYDRTAPLPDARLCPASKEGLREGRCQPGKCAAPDDARIICPLAFWGLTKSIERHLKTKGKSEAHELEVLADASSRTARLSAPQTALYATSVRVRPDDVDRLGEALNGALSGSASQAASWANWRDQIKAEHPSILVILPHTLPHPQFRTPAMEICDDEPLAGVNVREDLVCPSREHRPLVILLGCDTAAADSPIFDFPPKFRTGGAAIVLGTVTEVLGRHAAPVAGQIVTEIAKRAEAGEAYITDVVRDVRRGLLAEGQPLGMALVAYGDGEWLLGGG